MAHTAYPTVADLTAYLQSTGLTASSGGGLSLTGLDLQTAVDSGIGRFQRSCGRTFMATAPQTRQFDPPTNNRGILDLRQDICRIDSVTFQGVAQVAGQDYRAFPLDAPFETKPYNRLQFVNRFFDPYYQSLWGAIGVTGMWAYGLTIPDGAWYAMLATSALQLLPQIIHLFAGGVLNWTEADVTENYGPKPLKYLGDEWQRLYDDGIARYRRTTVGISGVW